MPKPDLYALVAELHGCGLPATMIARLTVYSRRHVMRILCDLGLVRQVRRETAAEAFARLPADVQAKIRALRSSVAQV